MLQPLASQLTTARLPLVAGISAATLALTCGGIAYASQFKTVTLDVDGEVQTVRVLADSVGQVLGVNGVQTEPQDLVQPAANTALLDGEQIVVRHASEVTIAVNDDYTTTLWVPALDADEALQALAARGDVALVASRSEGRVDLGIDLAPGQPVLVVVDGRQLVVDDAADIDAALAAANIKLGATDTVRVVPANTIGSNQAEVAVVVTRIVERPQTTFFDIDFETETTSDPGEYKGHEEVVQEGALGRRILVEQVRYVDGEEVNRQTVRDEVVLEPVSEIIAVGTKPKPAPVLATSGGGSAPAGTVWAALAQCESSGNPSLVSSNGLYYGLYQFSIPTWQSMGGTGLPSQASAAEQTMRAEMLLAAYGWGQWPACSAKLGLR